MAVGLNSRPKEWSRPPEPHPPDAGCWCSRNKRRPDVSLIWCSTPSGHRNGLRLWIQTNGRKTALQPLNLTLDFEHAHVSGHSTVIQATCSMQLGSRYHICAAVRVLQPEGLVISSRYRRRAELAMHDIRRSTIRRSRDDMRRCTIRLPREPASKVAKLASSLRRLELPARAARCALVFGLAVRSTESGSCWLRDR